MNTLFSEGLVKEVKPEFQKIPSPFRLFRYDGGDNRYYMTLDETTGLVKDNFLSVTSFCKASLGTSPFLINWIKKHGENSDNLRDERAAYGTSLHIYICQTLLDGKVNFSDARDFAMKQAVAYGFLEQANRWAMDMAMDTAAFYSFYKERVVEIIGLEFPIASTKYGLAGTMDIIAKVNFNRKTVNAIIDMKSGRKGFWESHELQLHVYKELWREHYDDVFPVTHVFNWAPTDWRETPKYNFENQTGSVFASTVLSRMRIAKNEGWVKPPTNKIWLDGEFDIRDFVPARHIKTLHAKGEEKQTEMWTPE